MHGLQILQQKFLYSKVVNLTYDLEQSKKSPNSSI